MLSFDKRVAFYRSWKYVFPAIAITAFLFIFWDIVFTSLGVWSFNPNHVSPVNIFGIPLEEVLFFFVIPYASLFTYEVLKAYIKKDFPEYITRYLIGFLTTFLIIIAVTNFNHLYTFFSFTILAILLFFLQFVFKVSYLGRFILAYGVVLVPFLVVNSILTGSFLKEPVVMYNDCENMGIRIFTIPFEDIFYGMLLILLNVSIYEKLKSMN